MGDRGIRGAEVAVIKIKRPVGSAPKVLVEKDALGPSERRKAELHFTDPRTAGQSFNFSAYRDPEIKEALARLFHNKCAYCESRYGATQPMEVEHWRPKASVVLADGRELTPGFYWLAAEWSNLLPSCIDCNRRRGQDDGTGVRSVSGKGNQFPVESAAPPATIAEVAAASPLLLNPCEDEPREHLDFMEQGFVRPGNQAGSPSVRGSASILVFALNRSGLAFARREHALLIRYRMELIRKLAILLQGTEEPMQQVLLEELLSHELFAIERAQGDDQPYAQLTRQLVARFAASLGLQPGPFTPPPPVAAPA